MKKFLPFKKAHEIVLKELPSYSINTERKWQYHKKYGYALPINIPYSPDIIYKNKGWISWGHWLGTNNIRGRINQYTVNHDFFKTWSHNMAYVLGFWFADGYIRKRKRNNGFSYGFSICQQSKDKYILKNILEIMKSNHPICQPKSRRNMSHFEINSKRIYEDIIKLGGVPNKSLVSSFPNVPKKYLRDFIRGYFDGDGCVFKNKKKNYITSYICSGSISFLEELQKIMNKFDFKTSICSNQNKNPCMKLNFGVNQTIKLGKFMYNNTNSLLKLNRKFEIFRQDEKRRRSVMESRSVTDIK